MLSTFVRQAYHSKQGVLLFIGERPTAQAAQRRRSGSLLRAPSTALVEPSFTRGFGGTAALPGNRLDMNVVDFRHVYEQEMRSAFTHIHSNRGFGRNTAHHSSQL